MVLSFVHLVLNQSSTYTVACLHSCFSKVSKNSVSGGPPVPKNKCFIIFSSHKQKNNAASKSFSTQCTFLACIESNFGICPAFITACCLAMHVLYFQLLNNNQITRWFFFYEFLFVLNNCHLGKLLEKNTNSICIC